MIVTVTWSEERERLLGCERRLFAVAATASLSSALPLPQPTCESAWKSSGAGRER